MSVIDTLKARAAPRTLAPADLKTELALAEAALAEAEAAHGNAALEALANSPGSDATLRDLESKLATRRQRVSTLSAAHAAAIRKEQAEIAAQRAALQKSQFNATRKHIARRDAAAAAVVKAIGDLATAYRELQTSSAKARAATPIGSTFPLGAHFEDHDIRRLVAAQMWKASAEPGDQDKLALPGAAFHDIAFQWNPGGIPALDATISAGSEYALAQVKPKGAAE